MGSDAYCKEKYLKTKAGRNANNKWKRVASMNVMNRDNQWQNRHNRWRHNNNNKGWNHRGTEDGKVIGRSWWAKRYSWATEKYVPHEKRSNRLRWMVYIDHTAGNNNLFRYINPKAWKKQQDQKREQKLFM